MGRFTTDFDPNAYKRTGGTTHYVSANITVNGDGLTVDTPCNLITAYERAADGDTIILLEGDYDRSNTAWGTTVLRKSINIIGQGTVRLFAGQRSPQLSFEKAAGFKYAYSASRSATVGVIDYAFVDGEYTRYARAASLPDCDSAEGTYFVDGDTVYVHALGHADPTGRVMFGIPNETYFDVDNLDGDTKVYIENIRIIGKPYGITFDRINPDRILSVTLVNSKLYHCGDATHNAISPRGGLATIVGCEIVGAGKDGINYTGKNTAGVNVEANFVEIDCAITDSGLGNFVGGEIQNATTAHTGSRVIRINGRYLRSNGALVGDVHGGTQSVNLGCAAFGSLSSTHSEGFSAQQAGAEMWLVGCVALGNDYDIFCVPGSALYIENCAYATSKILGRVTKRTRSRLIGYPQAPGLAH